MWVGILLHYVRYGTERRLHIILLLLLLDAAPIRPKPAGSVFRHNVLWSHTTDDP